MTRLLDTPTHIVDRVCDRYLNPDDGPEEAECPWCGRDVEIPGRCECGAEVDSDSVWSDPPVTDPATEGAI